MKSYMVLKIRAIPIVQQNFHSEMQVEVAFVAPESPIGWWYGHAVDQLAAV